MSLNYLQGDVYCDKEGEKKKINAALRFRERNHKNAMGCRKIASTSVGNISAKLRDQLAALLPPAAPCAKSAAELAEPRRVYLNALRKPILEMAAQRAVWPALQVGASAANPLLGEPLLLLLLLDADPVPRPPS